jgi:secondary thiamine-phosphate synthase enzyme
MRQSLHRLVVKTQGQGLVEITAAIKERLAHVDFKEGLLTVYCRHTSASLLIQENADPDVCKDLQTFFAKIAPEGRGLYVHESEGPDDMPAHIRAALTQTQLSIPMRDGELLLGTWQGIYLFEHRRAPHRREIVLHVIGE